MLNYLRIVVTALSLTACVLLIALWVRSYWWHDWIEIWYPNKYRVIDLTSCSGFLVFETLEGVGPIDDWRWFFETQPAENDSLRHAAEIEPFRLHVSPGTGSLAWSTPVLLPAMMLAMLAFIPWIRRFSLRTLLIATTLVAVGLGVIVMAS